MAWQKLPAYPHTIRNKVQVGSFMRLEDSNWSYEATLCYKSLPLLIAKSVILATTNWQWLVLYEQWGIVNDRKLMSVWLFLNCRSANSLADIYPHLLCLDFKGIQVYQVCLYHVLFDLYTTYYKRFVFELMLKIQVTVTTLLKL